MIIKVFSLITVASLLRRAVCDETDKIELNPIDMTFLIEESQVIKGAAGSAPEANHKRMLDFCRFVVNSSEFVSTGETPDTGVSWAAVRFGVDAGAGKPAVDDVFDFTTASVMSKDMVLFYLLNNKDLKAPTFGKNGEIGAGLSYVRDQIYTTENDARENATKVVVVIFGSLPAANSSAEAELKNLTEGMIRDERFHIFAVTVTNVLQGGADDVKALVTGNLENRTFLVKDFLSLNPELAGRLVTAIERVARKDAGEDSGKGEGGGVLGLPTWLSVLIGLLVVAIVIVGVGLVAYGYRNRNISPGEQRPISGKFG